MTLRTKAGCGIMMPNGGIYTVDVDITADDWKEKIDLPRQTMTLEVMEQKLPDRS